MTTTPTAFDTADTAAHGIAYAQLGWRSLPITPNSKQPAIADWPNAATTDHDLIRQWFTRWPDHGIGIATGKKSNLLVLDIDPAHGGDDSLADLEHNNTPLPHTVRAVTGGHGAHVLFTYPDLPPGKRIGNSAGKLGPGLDIRGEGGQIVVAPTIHPVTGNAYAWEEGHRPDQAIVVDMPQWLIDLLIEDDTAIPEGQVEASTALDDRFAWDRYQAQPSANAEAVRLLTAAGWHSPRTDRNGVTYLTRPGKTAGAGAGCSVGKVAAGVVYVFTDGAPPLTPGGYRLPELLAQLAHNGNRQVTDEILVQQGWGAPTWPTPTQRAQYEAWVNYQHQLATAVGDGVATGPSPATTGNGPLPVHWPDFWTRERRPDDWAIPPIVPAGRLVTVWAARKTGKSLFVLDIAAAAACGRPILGGATVEPVNIIYLDMEMTEDDLEERLGDLGYGPDTDLTHLHYYLLPTLPPLDTDAGGDALMRLVERHRPAVVIIDTMARVISGEENDADTYRRFYRLTGMRLKQAGVACLRLDHAGKDKTKGERGSSAKGDDVDLSWELVEVGGGEFLLKRSYTRISWVAESIKMRREAEPLRHTAGIGAGYLAGTSGCAQHLDDLELPLDITKREAITALREHNLSPRGDRVVLDAIRYRKSGAQRRDNSETETTVTEAPEVPKVMPWER